MPNDLSFTQTSDLIANVLQNLTLTVTPSSNFRASSYTYQWRAGGTNISQATNSSYSFDAPASTTTYTCLVSGLSGNNNTPIFHKITNGIVVTIQPDTSIFARHLPRGANPLNETGAERFKRIRNMGYC